MGRNAKPISLHLLEGNPNRLTKTQIAAREAAEIHLGDYSLKCPQFVKSDAVAYAKWKECIKIFEGKKIVTSADAGHLARYCKTFSEYQDLCEHRRVTQSMESFSEEEIEQIEGEFITRIGERAAKKMWQKVEYILSVGGLLAIDKAINAKLTALNAMEDRLFLHPLARVKNVPKKPEEKPKDPLQAAGFGNV
jgi:phage terminase small subunit